jgi:hypothetical protein
VTYISSLHKSVKRNNSIRPGWNPTKRNRKIGTADQGFSKNNKLVIPQKWSDLTVCWERLINSVVNTTPCVRRHLHIDMPTTLGKSYSKKKLSGLNLPFPEV